MDALAHKCRAEALAEVPHPTESHLAASQPCGPINEVSEATQHTDTEWAARRACGRGRDSVRQEGRRVGAASVFSSVEPKNTVKRGREKGSANRTAQHEQRRSHALHAPPLHRTHFVVTLSDHAHPFSFPFLLHKESEESVQR